MLENIIICVQVRRAAAKCLEAIISTHPELLDMFYKQVSPQLIARYNFMFF